MSITIEAPIERVWEYASDIHRQPEWMHEMKRVELLTPPPIGVGSRGRATVRIFGIEAPERDQLCRVPQGRWSCGEHARSALQDLIRDRPVACAPVREDVFAGVTVARCSVAGRDIGATMVADELADVLIHGGYLAHGT